MKPHSLTKSLRMWAVLVAVMNQAIAGVVEANLSALAQADSGLVGLDRDTGDIVRSTDGGANFTVVRSAGSLDLYNLVASGDTVIATGDGGFMVRSTDGGANWSEASTSAFVGELLDGASDGTNWVVVGTNNNKVTVFRSTNDGQSWSSTSVPNLNGSLKGATYDLNTGLWTAVGSDGLFSGVILSSPDGASWASVTVPAGASPLTDVAADGNGNVLAVGEAGTLLISADGGATFSLDANSGIVSENLNVVVYSATAGWVAGGTDLTQVGYSTGGGAVLTQSPVPGAGDITALAVDGSGEVLSGGDLSTFQSISFAGPGEQSFASGSVTLSATASSGLEVAFELVSGPATLDGATVTFTGTGTVVVRASQNGNESFAPAASVQRSFAVVKDSATVTITGLAATYNGSPQSVTVTTDPDGLSFNVTYDGSATEPTDAGTYTVVATVDDATYQGTATETFEVAQADQTITFAGPADQDISVGTVVLSGSTDSGLAVSFSLDSGPATLDGNTLTLTDAGTVTITASQAGNSNYAAADSVTRSFEVTVSQATVTLDVLEAVYDGTAKEVSVSTIPSGLNVVVTYDGGDTPPTAVGSYAVVATIDDATFSGSTSGTFVIVPAPQEISFSPTTEVPFTFDPIDLTATASSGLPVTFSVQSGDASIEGNDLVLSGTGEVVVRASQAGDANNVAAEPVDVTITVTINFDGWRADNFSAEELGDDGISGEEAVVTADGISNLMKYALGLSAHEVEELPTMVFAAETGFVFSYSRPSGLPDVAYVVEASTDLTSWSSEGVTHEMSGSAAGIETWRASVTYEVASNVFFRLKVSRIE